MLPPGIIPAQGRFGSHSSLTWVGNAEAHHPHAPPFPTHLICSQNDHARSPKGPRGCRARRKQRSPCSSRAPSGDRPPRLHNKPGDGGSAKCCLYAVRSGNGDFWGNGAPSPINQHPSQTGLQPGHLNQFTASPGAFPSWEHQKAEPQWGAWMML